MRCPNPTCPLSWATETDPATGLVRPHGTGEPWRVQIQCFDVRTGRRRSPDSRHSTRQRSSAIIGACTQK